MPEPVNQYGIPSDVVAKKIKRCLDLKEANQESFLGRDKMRAILDHGLEGIRLITGRELSADDPDVPILNMLLMANTRLGQKLAPRPDVKIDSPAHVDHDRASKRAEKRARLVESYDRAAKLKMQLPQNGRWITGYAFTPWVVREHKDINGDPYPHAQLRDAYNCFPGEWGLDQQPREIAFFHRITKERLADLYPQHKNLILDNAGPSRPRVQGGVLLGSVEWGRPSWANQTREGLEVYEYIDADGTWWVCPELSMLLEFVPNPISRPPFYIMKRFSFNKLKGQFDHAVGLMGSVARLNVLSVLAAEDIVFSETNIYGETMSGKYQRGHRAVNHMAPGSRVERVNASIPFQVFGQIDMLMDQLRSGTSYNKMNDGVSPNSFVTGQGLQELKSDVELEIAEYRTIIEDGLEMLDSMRLEWDDKLYGNLTKKMHGVRGSAPFSESYKPSSLIGGDYTTRRVYGIMAGWDEPNKIIGGINLMLNGIISRDDVRENLSGLENHVKVGERVRSEMVEQNLLGVVGQLAQSGDPNSITAMVELLPEGDLKSLFMATLVEPAQQAAEQASQQQQVQQQAGPGPIPGVQTALNRMTNTDRPVQGVQTVTTP